MEWKQQSLFSEASTAWGHCCYPLDFLSFLTPFILDEDAFSLFATAPFVAFDVDAFSLFATAPFAFDEDAFSLVSDSFLEGLVASTSTFAFLAAGSGEDSGLSCTGFAPSSGWESVGTNPAAMTALTSSKVGLAMNSRVQPKPELTGRIQKKAEETQSLKLFTSQ